MMGRRRFDDEGDPGASVAGQAPDDQSVTDRRLWLWL